MEDMHGGNIYRDKIRYDFSSSINPYGMAEKVHSAIEKSLDFSTRYPDPTCRNLRIRLSKKLHIGSLENFLIGNGASELIYALTFYIATKYPLSSVYIPVPTFLEYKNAAETAGLNVKKYYLKEKNNFNFSHDDVKDFLKNIPDDCSIIYFCNPGNPTGELIDSKILSELISGIAEKNNKRFACGKEKILVLIDESFLPLTGRTSESYIEDARHRENILVLRSFTKMYAMAGLRLGYMYGDFQILSEIRHFLQPWNVSIPANAAGEAALELNDYVETSLSLIEKERDYLSQKLKQMNFNPIKSDSNYILFSYGKDIQDNDHTLYEMLKKDGILIRDCSNFDGLCQGYYRVAVRTRVENTELIDLLMQIISNLDY